MATEQMILVNDRDEPVGIMEKMEVHKRGLLHRAFSVFVFDSKGRFLLQQRATSKYHSSGLWTNTCCSHPRPNDKVEEAAARRLKEEMGITSNMKEIFSFVSKADLGKDIWEHEFDHVFLGKSDEFPLPNKSEVSEWKWMSIESITNEIDNHPNDFTIWFQLIFKDVARVYREG